MRHVLKTAILVGALAGAAFAQDATEGTTPPPAAAEGSVTAVVLEGAEVFGVDGQGMGEVTDVVTTDTGEIEAAIISVGGFLGFGRHSVAIPMEDLSVMERQDDPGEMIVQVPMTVAELKEMPEYEPPAPAAPPTN